MKKKTKAPKKFIMVKGVKVSAPRKPTPRKLDLRTKAGRAWKAKQVQLVLREKALARERARAEAVGSVTGSWLDKAALTKAARGGPTSFFEPFTYNLPTAALKEALASIALDKDPEGSTHYEGDPCPGGHLHDLHGDSLELPPRNAGTSIEDIYKRLEASRPASVAGAYTKVMV